MSHRRLEALLIAAAIAAAVPATAFGQSSDALPEAGRPAGDDVLYPRSDKPGESTMLNDEQLSRIRQALEKAAAQTAPSAGIDIRPGAVLPRTTPLEPVPQEVAAIAPGYAAYSYAEIEGRLCIVDPKTLIIIAVLS